MKRNARLAYNALEKLGAPVIDHGDPEVQWGAHFIIGAELRNDDDVLFADFYGYEVSERMENGKVVNAFGIRQDVLDILGKHDLFAEWIDPGVLGVYDN